MLLQLAVSVSHVFIFFGGVKTRKLRRRPRGVVFFYFWGVYESDLTGLRLLQNRTVKVRGV